MFFTVSDVRTVAGRADEYLAYRRDEVNPAMAAMPGFKNSLIVRNLAEPNRFVLFNGWDAEPSWRAYQATRKHDELRLKIRGELTGSMEIIRTEVVDLPNGGGLVTPRQEIDHFTLSTHTVRPEAVDEYFELRRDAVNPGMAALPGFRSTTLLRKLDVEPRSQFFVVNQWAKKENSDAYAASGLHDSLKVRVRSLLANHSGTQELETVLL
jgi:heme-degrading monooxygenase HmoA